MAAPRRSAGVGSGTGYADVSELDKYKMVSCIGKGSFGVITKVQRIDDGKEFALKQLDYSKMTDKDRKQILAEVAILESLKHKNIVQLIQKIKDPKNERIYIVMEYCTSGDLSTLIRKSQRSGMPIHEDKIWNIFLQITMALHHCHWPNERSAPGKRPSGLTRLSGGSEEKGGIARYQVLHRDLKPENVFLSDDFVKLGDFGLSKDMGTNAFTNTYVGTPLYMPPEILAENKYDTKSDIWSLGCLIFEMCTLASPFSTAQTQAELITMVKSGKLPPLPAHISPPLKSAIKAMLNLSPTRRPSTTDLLEMDEMKLHRKLFTVQNHSSILLSRKAELQNYETSLNAKATQLAEREKSVAARELTLAQREKACEAKEESVQETDRRLKIATEKLRGDWEKFVAGRDRVVEDKALSKRPSTMGVRPALEERATAPVGQLPRRQHALYEDTPSKPSQMACASPSPFVATPLPQRTHSSLSLRKNTKSLGNLAAAARGQAASSSSSSNSDFTPAKQIMHGHAHRRSIGSPGDISMAIATPAPPSPFVPRPRRSSLAPEMPTILPTQIPAPTNTFTYRELATPAKWAAEDPDLPSPFLKRMPTAPPNLGPAIPPRNPLGAISVQPSLPTGGLRLKPRSKSGGGNGLIAAVLRNNAVKSETQDTLGEGRMRAREQGP